MKTYIQLDVQNLFFSAKDIDKRIDFLKIRDHFYNSGDDITQIVAYLVRSPEIGKSEKFENFLESIGYTLSVKKAIISYNREGSKLFKNTDQDISICIDCMKNIDKFDKWVLMSGDGDFIDLCRELKKRKKIVEVWALAGTSFNKRFCDYADSIQFIGEPFFYKDNKKEESSDNRETNQKECENEKSRSNLQTLSATPKKNSTRKNN